MYWPALLLDYRCHVPRGRLGTAFPPPMRRCLRRLADSPRAALMRRYGAAGDGGEGARLASKLDALKRRAALLLRYG